MPSDISAVAMAVRQSTTEDGLRCLLHDLRAYVHRYVVVTPEQALTIALWIAVTHVLDAFDTVAYPAGRRRLPDGESNRRSGSGIRMIVCGRGAMWIPRLAGNLRRIRLV